MKDYGEDILEHEDADLDLELELIEEGASEPEILNVEFSEDDTIDLEVAEYDLTDTDIRQDNMTDMGSSDIDMPDTEVYADDTADADGYVHETLELTPVETGASEDYGNLLLEELDADGEDDIGDEDEEIVIGGEDENNGGYGENTDASGLLRFIKSKYAVLAGIATVIIAVAIGSAAVFSGMHKNNNITDDTVPAVKTTEAAAQVVATKENKEEAARPMPLQGMKLEAVADESSITARILDETGEALKGHDFVVRLYSGSLADNKEKVDKLLERQRELATLQTPSDAASSEETVRPSEHNDNDGSSSYKDEDKNGEVVIKELAAGIYTLVVEAEAGFEVPEAAEATVVKHEVIENIKEKVEEQNHENEKDDPHASRGDGSANKPGNGGNAGGEGTEGSGNTGEPDSTEGTTAPIVTAPPETNSKIVITITHIGKDGEKILYTAKDTGNILNRDDVREYINDENYVTAYLKDGSSLDGYVYEAERVNVSDGEYDVIKKLLVAADPKRATSGIYDMPLARISASRLYDALAHAKGGKKSAGTGKKPLADEAGSQDETFRTDPAQDTSTQGQESYRVFDLSVVIEEETKVVYNGWYSDASGMHYYDNGTPFTGWHWIDGHNYYFNNKGILSSTLVIDVSTYNGDIDWNRVKASGIDNVIIRLGYRGWGTARIVKDSRFDQNVRGAKRAGLNVGAYFVTQAINTAEAVEEASFIVQEARQNGMNLPLAIDVEWAGDRNTGEQGRANSLTAGERTAVINAFCETVKNAGYTPMAYASKSWFNSYINAPAIVPYAQIWVAQYADINETTYNGRYDMWQFRSDGRVDGIGGNVDISAYLR